MTQPSLTHLLKVNCQGAAIPAQLGPPSQISQENVDVHCELVRDFLAVLPPPRLQALGEVTQSRHLIDSYDQLQPLVAGERFGLLRQARSEFARVCGVEKADLQPKP